MFCINYDQIDFIHIYAFVMTILALIGFIKSIWSSTNTAVIENNLRCDNDYYEQYIDKLEKDLKEAELRAEIYNTEVL